MRKNPIAEKIGRNIVREAEKTGTTFQKLAVDTNVREETMRKWLTGERTITVYGLVRVARALGVPMEALTKGLF